MAVDKSKTKPSSRENNVLGDDRENVGQLPDASIMWDRLQRIWNIFQQRIQIQEKMGALKRVADERPLMTLFTVVAIFVISIPIACFAVFAFWSAVAAFIGFVFVEGIILACATLLMGGVLFIFVFFSIALATSAVLAVLAFRSSKSLCSTGQETWEQIRMHGLDYFRRTELWKKYAPSSSSTIHMQHKNE